MGIIKEYQDGNATVKINNAYYTNRTPEQEQMDKDRLKDAIYNLIDHLVEQGEAV